MDSYLIGPKQEIAIKYDHFITEAYMCMYAVCKPDVPQNVTLHNLKQNMSQESTREVIKIGAVVQTKQ
jgi:hypothetical protein